MGQKVEALTSDWQGALTDNRHGSIGFEGFLGHKDGNLSSEFAVIDFDPDVPVMEGGFKSSVASDGTFTIEENL